MKQSFILIVTLIIVIGLFYTRLSLTLVSIGIIAAFIGTLAGGGRAYNNPSHDACGYTYPYRHCYK